MAALSPRVGQVESASPQRRAAKIVAGHWRLATVRRSHRVDDGGRRPRARRASRGQRRATLGLLPGWWRLPTVHRRPAAATVGGDIGRVSEQRYPGQRQPALPSAARRAASRAMMAPFTVALREFGRGRGFSATLAGCGTRYATLASVAAPTTRRTKSLHSFLTVVMPEPPGWRTPV